MRQELNKVSVPPDFSGGKIVNLFIFELNLHLFVCMFSNQNVCWNMCGEDDMHKKNYIILSILSYSFDNVGTPIEINHVFASVCVRACTRVLG